MDITPNVLDRVILPPAAFAEPYSPAQDSSSCEDKATISWAASTLNPKNRIDSLAPLPKPKWRIDGCSGLGSVFHAVPIFLGNIIPLRVDISIPIPSRLESELQTVLETASLFHLHDSRVARLGISNHLVRALERWTCEIPDFRALYENLPFGSRLKFQNINKDIRKIKIEVVENYTLERQLLSLKSVRLLWNLPESAWPDTVDISQVHLLRQLSDSVSLVKLKRGDTCQTVACKALTNNPKYLYHELKLLLTIPPHPNIISRPLHLITKRCNFGGKVAIVGFTSTYHPRGTLRDIIPFQQIHGTVDRGPQLRWASQITSALIHIRESGFTYSDLRLDNILLSDHNDIVLVDFEQRGLWCSFAAPEVNYLDYIHTLARSDTVPPEMRLKYQELGAAHTITSQPKSKEIHRYDNPECGYWEPWWCLSRREQEFAEVFALGRVLWCLFEGVSAPEMSVWVSYVHESPLSFPNYCRTPPELRELINSCTTMEKGFLDWGSGGVVRRGNQLVIREGDEKLGPEIIQEKASEWWRMVLKDAERFLRIKLQNRQMGKDTIFGRPTLKEVLKTLGHLQ
jgi:serine/threonine protein kinase